MMDPTRKFWFCVFVPTQYTVEDLPVIVFFHGGGYIVVSPDAKITHDFCCKSIWLPENANISCCFIAGDSAGRHIAHHLVLRVIGLVAIHPFFGGEERTDSEIRLAGSAPILSTKLTDWLWNVFMPLGEPYNRDHPIINVSGPNSVDISKMDFPATMVVVAGFDILRDWQIRYYEWLKKSGKEAYLVDYPNMFHDFCFFPAGIGPTYFGSEGLSSQGVVKGMLSSNVNTYKTRTRHRRKVCLEQKK
ncbi:putative carboxylesterase [Helianthus anomalus]